MEQTEKRGRKPMSDEEKLIAKQLREQNKGQLNLVSDTDIFEVIEVLQKSIKKGVTKLNLSEVDKLKNTLTKTLESIDVIIKEKLIKEIEQKTKELEELKKQL